MRLLLCSALTFALAPGALAQTPELQSPGFYNLDLQSPAFYDLGQFPGRDSLEFERLHEFPEGPIEPNSFFEFKEEGFAKLDRFRQFMWEGEQRTAPQNPPLQADPRR